jgi:pyrimidine-nucleoside phosphorylase
VRATVFVAEAMIRPAELIERKRNGGELTPEELRELMTAYARDEVPDYQLAALCMAIYFRGLTSAETYAMTEAMIATARRRPARRARPQGRRQALDRRRGGQDVDRGRPDRRCLRVPFAKMSGRGLGHTGGTLDKLESIPGFRVELSTTSSSRRCRTRDGDHRASANLVPADKKLYALRDVTATVDNVSADRGEHHVEEDRRRAQAIVIDAKVGDGAFMKSIEDARALAEAMLDLAQRADRSGVPPDRHDRPLGAPSGNALEIREAVATLRGDGPPDFLDSFWPPLAPSCRLGSRHRRRPRAHSSHAGDRRRVGRRGVRTLDSCAGRRSGGERSPTAAVVPDASG